jgi:hypothetical protein
MASIESERVTKAYWSAPEGVRMVSRCGAGTTAGARHRGLGARLGRLQMRPRDVGPKLVQVRENGTGER